MLVLYHIQVFHSFNTMFPSVYSFINQMICILQTGGTSSIKVNCVFLYLFTPYISYRHYHNHTYTLHCTWTDYCIGQDIYNYIDDKSQYAAYTRMELIRWRPWIHVSFGTNVVLVSGSSRCWAQDTEQNKKYNIES